MEIKACLQGLDWQIKSLADFRDVPQIVEDADTFEGNATKKALIIRDTYGFPTLSDDSGLEVDALCGEPGVHSARYGSPDLDDDGRCKYLLKNLEDTPSSERTARFLTVMVFAMPQMAPVVFNGTMEGRIADEPKGKSGFGYDPVFIPTGMSSTIAELGPEIKNQISHRAKAINAFYSFIKDFK